MRAFVYPGQGAQYKNMGKSLYDNFKQARDFFSAVSGLLDVDVAKICFESEEEELNEVYTQQLAILAVSLAVYEVFKHAEVKIDFYSGLSLGMYTCLYPAGVLSLEDLVFLVKKRAEITKATVEEIPSVMLAVNGMEKDFLCKLGEDEGFYVSNVNSPRQVVISVKEEDKQKIKGILAKNKARGIEIKSGGGFHSPFMKPAEERMKKYIDLLDFKNPKSPVVTNLTGKPTIDQKEIKSSILGQLSRPVLWKSCIETMVNDGVDTFFTAGPSKVLWGLIKEISPESRVIHLETKKDFDRFYKLCSNNFFTDKRYKSPDQKA